MKIKHVKEILSSYDDNDEVAFVVYDITDACLIAGRAITAVEGKFILDKVQEEIISCIDLDLCETILEELKNDRQKSAMRA